MQVVRKKPGEMPELIRIENTLEALQKEVGGYIETFGLASDAVLVCNEEGKLLGLPYNITLFGEPFVGTILIAGDGGEELASVPEPDFWMKQLEELMETD